MPGGVALQHQLSKSNASSTIGRIKSSPAGKLASARLARFAETEAIRAMQFKQARNFSNMKPEASERIRLVETALRAAAQGCAPQASSGNRHGDRQLSPETPSSDAKRFTKSRIVAVISLALVLPTLGVAVWLSVHHGRIFRTEPNLPSPVLTAPAFLKATARRECVLPISLDGTDGVPAHSSIAITGLPQGSTLSKGQPLAMGDRNWTETKLATCGSSCPIARAVRPKSQSSSWRPMLRRGRYRDGLAVCDCLTIFAAKCRSH